MPEEILFLVEEAIEGCFNAHAIDNSIFTQADTLNDLKIQIKDAIFILMVRIYLKLSSFKPN